MGFRPGSGAMGAPGGTLPAGTEEGDILVWNATTSLWEPKALIGGEAHWQASSMAAADPSILVWAPTASASAAANVSTGFTRHPMPEQGFRLLGIVVGLHTGGVQTSTSTWTVWVNGVITTLAVALPQALAAGDLRAQNFLATPLTFGAVVRSYAEVRVTHSGGILANSQPSAKVIYDYYV